MLEASWQPVGNQYHSEKSSRAGTAPYGFMNTRLRPESCDGHAYAHCSHANPGNALS